MPCPRGAGRSTPPMTPSVGPDQRREQHHGDACDDGLTIVSSPATAHGTRPARRCRTDLVHDRSDLVCPLDHPSSHESTEFEHPYHRSERRKTRYTSKSKTSSFAPTATHRRKPTINKSINRSSSFKTQLPPPN